MNTGMVLHIFTHIHTYVCVCIYIYRCKFCKLPANRHRLSTRAKEEYPQSPHVRTTPLRSELISAHRAPSLAQVPGTLFAKHKLYRYTGAQDCYSPAARVSKPAQ